MTERLLSLIDKFVYSAARHGSYVLVLLAALSYNVETVAPAHGFVVLEAADHGEQNKAVVSHSRTIHDTQQIVVGLDTTIAPSLGFDRAGAVRQTVETYSIAQTIRHFDARGSPGEASLAV